jgi:hypothetical protein
MRGDCCVLIFKWKKYDQPNFNLIVRQLMLVFERNINLVINTLRAHVPLKMFNLSAIENYFAEFSAI